MWRRSGPTGTRGSSTTGWDAYREEVFARQKELGVIPADAELSRHDPDVPEWESLSPDARRLATRLMEVFAGFLSHTDAPDRAAAGLPARDRRAGQHADHGDLRQRRQRRGRGRPAPPTRRSSSTTPRSRWRTAWPSIDEIGGPTTFNHYPWGWTWAGNTPFRRWKRETYRGGASDPFLVHWPAGIAARGEVRTQYAHIIDMVPTVLDVLGHRAARQHPRRHAGAAARGQLRPYLRRRGRPDAAPHAVLRDVRPPGDRPRRVAGGLPVAGALVRRGRRPVRYPDHGRDAGRARRRTLGALPRRPRTSRRTTTSPPRTAARLIELIAQWYVEAGQLQRAAHRRQRRDPADGRAPAAHRRRGRATRSGRAPRCVPASAGPRVLNRPHSITADVDIPDGGAEGVLLCQGSQQRRFRLLREGPAAALRPQLPQPRHLPACPPPDPLPEGSHRLRFEFEPTGEPDFPNGRGAPGRAQLYVDDQLVGPDRHPGDRPDRVQPGRPDRAEPTPGRRS